VSVAVRNALNAARRAFTKKFPATVSSRRLDALLGDMDLFRPDTPLDPEQKKNFWKGFARLCDADATPGKARFIAAVRRYVGRKNDKWLIMALGEIEYFPETLLHSVFLRGRNWRDDIPEILAERLIDEDRWDFLLANVNTNLRNKLMFARRSTLRSHNRYDLALAASPDMQGPAAPRLPDGFSLADLGFATADPRNAAALKGWMGAGLMGWGDVGQPLTRTLATTFPDDGTSIAGLPRSVEGFVILRRTPRSAVAKRVQHEVVRDFLHSHPSFGTYWDTDRQITMTYDFDAERYIAPDAPADLAFNNPAHAVYWKFPKWNGSHLGAHSFGFDTIRSNVIPLPARINQSYMAYVEELVRDLYYRYDGKVYLRAEVLEYDAHGLAKVVRYEAFVPGADDMPVRILNESVVTDYAPDFTKVNYLREAEKQWLIHEEWLKTENPP